MVEFVTLISMLGAPGERFPIRSSMSSLDWVAAGAGPPRDPLNCAVDISRDRLRLLCLDSSLPFARGGIKIIKGCRSKVQVYGGPLSLLAFEEKRCDDVYGERVWSRRLGPGWLSASLTGPATGGLLPLVHASGYG